MSIDRTALAATLASMDPRQTIRPPSLETTVAHAGDAASLPVKLERLRERLELGATIGQGGMAIVRGAKQTSLHREVAVKTLRADATDHASPRLLREAWITGALEHPNIVPVHDLGADERGRPLLVLKRIEGEPWKIAGASLDDNLATLMQVCHAIAFAHSRHIVHRDLKPANIMIGGFGEVYVLDWGIAVSTVDDGSGRLPLAADCREIAGTLAYMAPEMLGEAPPSERTDIFLLGAILFEIAEGKPPHLLDSVAAALDSIQQCAPAFADDSPEELVAIAKRAMARDPAARYSTADELRLAIVAFLEHRSSAEIARESEETLEQLEAQLQAAVTEEISRVTVYQLFGQCRFGFQAALRAWPENAPARTGLDRALALMASHELDHGDARAASVLISELATPRPDLTERLATAERDTHEKRRKLERYELDQDVHAGALTRTMFLALVGIAWAVMPIVASLVPIVPINYTTSISVSAFSLALFVGFAVWARDSLRKTSMNRGVLLTVLFGLTIQCVIEAIGYALGLPLTTTHLLSLSLWAGACGNTSVFIDRSLLVPTLGFLGAMAAIVLWPNRQLWAIAGASLTLLSIVFLTRHRELRGRRIVGFADLLRRKD